ncbi:MAG: hypothetical protein V1896_02330 [Candidatus Zambryskibacteria bacterium]
MKKILLITTSVLVLFSVAQIASADTLSVVSDASTPIIGVYNKAGGASNYVSTSFNAVVAAEPTNYPTTYAVGALNSVWDNGTGLYFQNTNPDAEWIWETERAEGPSSYAPSNPLYDADASKYGRVVVFEKKFTLTGAPQDSTLNIATDNGWEVWINGVLLERSSTAADGWVESNLHENFLNTTNWQNVRHVNVLASMLTCGENTIKIFAGNEYFAEDDAPNFSPAFTSNPYRQYNPGALIFKMDVSYDAASPCCPKPKCCGGKVEVKNRNSAVIINSTSATSNTGNNFAGSNGGSGGSAFGGSNANGGNGSNTGSITTGDAKAKSKTINIINTNATRIRR